MNADRCGETPELQSLHDDIVTISGCRVLSWTRMQARIAMPSNGAEHVAMAASTQEALFVQNIAKELGVDLQIILRCVVFCSISLG